ncbi:MAG: N-acetylmuramoyl-L-alanine amidase [Acidobacteriia bacterium]|nr:N-acetylmuramoyl-L-alanine amidase [Terriglobia bacterium]
MRLLFFPLAKVRAPDPRRFLIASTEFLLFFLLLSHTGLLSIAAENVILYTDTQSKILLVTPVEGERYLALQDLLSTLGPVTEVEKTASVLQIKVGKHSLLFRPNSTLVVIDGILTSMGDPALVMPAGWMVPVDSISKILPRLTDRKVTFRQDAPRAFVTSQPPSRVFFEATKGILSSRVAIQVTQAAPFELKQEGKQLVVTLGNPPLEPTAEKLNYADDRIKSIVYDDADARPKIRITLSSANFDVKSSTTQEGRIFVVMVSPPQQISPPTPGTAAQSPAAPPPATAAPGGAGTKGQEKAAVLPTRGILRIVTIDPGHGGLDSGSRAANNAAVEKDVALQIAHRLRASLQQRLGLQVYLTRDADDDVSLDQRASAANTIHSDVFISIHVGFSLVQSWIGARVYVYSPIKEATPAPKPVPSGLNSTEQRPVEKPPVAHLYFRDWTKANASNFQINQALAELFESELAPLWGQEPAAPRIAPLRPSANVVMPAVMVELGNLNSETDVKQMVNPQFQARIASAITNAIQRYKPVYDAQVGSAPAGKPKAGPDIQPGKQEKTSPR